MSKHKSFLNTFLALFFAVSSISAALPLFDAVSYSHGKISRGTSVPSGSREFYSRGQLTSVKANALLRAASRTVTPKERRNLESKYSVPGKLNALNFDAQASSLGEFKNVPLAFPFFSPPNKASPLI